MGDDHPIVTNWKPTDTLLIRALAALLIANSHLEHYYPRSWMAGDGLTGNAFFYFLSGFGVALGAESRGRGFVSWYWRRISRIYPSVIIGILVLGGLLQHSITSSKLYDLAWLFIFPTRYGFVGHIVLIYFGLYWLLKVQSSIPLIIVTILIYCISAGSYIADGQSSWSFHYFFFTTIALLGAILARISRRPSESFRRDFAILVLLSITYFLLKFVMVKGHLSREYILLHWLTSLLCIFLVRVSAADATAKFLKHVPAFNAVLTFLAGLTLQIYILQTHTTDAPWIVSQNFPMNLALFWLTTIAGAWALKLVAGWIETLIKPRVVVALADKT